MTDMFKGDDAALIERLEVTVLEMDGIIRGTQSPLPYSMDDVRKILTRLISETKDILDAARATDDAALVTPEPVAWRVKDFADGWILYHSEAQARREAEEVGSLVQPLFARAAAPGANDPLTGFQIEGVDEEIRPLISALWSAGIGTKASCSGHGHRPGNIVLADGRELVVAPDYETARKIDALFPVDINGNASPPLGGTGGWKPEREAVAREVDPNAWAFADRWAHDPTMAAEVKNETFASLRRAERILALPAAPYQGESVSDDVIDRVATAAMVCVTPHLKHMISYSNLWTAVRSALLAPQPSASDGEG